MQGTTHSADPQHLCPQSTQAAAPKCALDPVRMLARTQYHSVHVHASRLCPHWSWVGKGHHSCFIIFCWAPGCTSRILILQMQVVVGILARCEARLLGMTDMEKMVDFLRAEVPRWPHDRLQVGQAPWALPQGLHTAQCLDSGPEQAECTRTSAGVMPISGTPLRVTAKLPAVIKYILLLIKSSQEHPGRRTFGECITVAGMLMKGRLCNHAGL